MRHRLKCFAVMILVCVLTPHPVLSEGAETALPDAEAGADSRVEVRPEASDTDIDRRLSRILESTGWFEDIRIEVNDGVVFLDGLTASEEHRDWAGSLARRTRDVVAVVNRIQIETGPAWNLSPAIEGLHTLVQRIIRALPLLGLSLAILIAAFASARISAVIVRKFVQERLKPLVADVVARTLAMLVFLVGLYLVLHIAGWTGLATTIVGGTGLAGLVAGIAFRDILENFLASMLISVRNPFRLGDVVDIGGHFGVVHRVTSRGTVLMDLNGNHIQIPNATVYKSIIQNFTANPNRREFFDVGIGYDCSVAAAQDIALAVLQAHPEVLDDPEALVLADRLGAATVNLKIYFWYNGLTSNGPKMRSSLVRQIKAAFQDEGISMPDEAREIVFPEGVPVQLTKEDAAPPKIPDRSPRPPEGRSADSGATYTEAEGRVEDEAEQIRKQAEQARSPDEATDLLSESDNNPDRPDKAD